jgi:hypothetical protein
MDTDITELYNYYYNIVNNIIFDIHISNILNYYLAYCNYTSLNIDERYELPLTICLGGSGFIQYNHILKNERLVKDIQLKSNDYDISFSFKNIESTNKNIKTIVKEIQKIYNDNMNNFKYNKLQK